MRIALKFGKVCIVIQRLSNAKFGTNGMLESRHAIGVLRIHIPYVYFITICQSRLKHLDPASVIEPAPNESVKTIVCSLELMPLSNFLHRGRTDRDFFLPKQFMPFCDEPLKIDAIGAEVREYLIPVILSM